MRFVFTNQAHREYQKLDAVAQVQIRKKLEKIKVWASYHLKPLTNLEPATHRLRVGDYRLLLRDCGEYYEVLKVWHRSKIYK